MGHSIITLDRFRYNFNSLCENIRDIFHNNYSFVTLFFLLLYSFEQGILIYFSVESAPNLARGIGFFVLILLTTIAVERLLMESKNKRLDNYNNLLRKEKSNILRKYIRVKRDLKRLKQQ
jgi:uncharacterized membrane protein (DUF485 family)